MKKEQKVNRDNQQTQSWSFDKTLARLTFKNGEKTQTPNIRN